MRITNHNLVFIKPFLMLSIAFAGHTDAVTGLKFSPGTERLITCSRDKSFRVHDINTGTEVYVKFMDEQLK